MSMETNKEEENLNDCGEPCPCDECPQQDACDGWEAHFCCDFCRWCGEVYDEAKEDIVSAKKYISEGDLVRDSSGLKTGVVIRTRDYGIVYLRDDAVDTLIKYIEELGG